MTIYYHHLAWTGVNLLTENQASIETNTTGWVVDGNCTLSRSTVEAAQGAASLALTSVAGGDMAATTLVGTSGIPVVAGQAYSVILQIRAATAARTAFAAIRWYDATGATISTVISPSVADSTSAWTTYTISSEMAPPGAAFAAIGLGISGTGGAGEVHYGDAFMFSAGAPSAWTAGVSDLFDYWEVQRYEPFIEEWVNIAVLPIATIEFDDYEASRGVAEIYRLRSVDIYGAPSAWTAEETSTIPVTGCKYEFTSNESPVLNLEYDDLRPRDYGFPEDPQVLDLHNRYGVAVFRHTEDRGLSFTINLILAAEGAPSFPSATPGIETFYPIVVIARANLPYVCVKDSDGVRLYCALFPPTNPDAQRYEPGGLYTIPVAVREVADRPTPVDRT